MGLNYELESVIAKEIKTLKVADSIFSSNLI